MLDFLIANEEPIVEVNTISPYSLLWRTEKHFLVSTNCQRNILLMYSVSNDLFDFHPLTSQLELCRVPLLCFLKLFMKLYETKRISKLTSFSSSSSSFAVFRFFSRMHFLIFGNL